MIFSNCLFHCFFHNRLHLVLYAVSGLNDYLVMLHTHNACSYPLQRARNEAQSQFETIGTIPLDGPVKYWLSPFGYADFMPPWWSQPSQRFRGVLIS